MNFVMTIRTHGLEVLINIIFVISITMMNGEVAKIFVTAFLAADLPLPLHGENETANFVVRSTREKGADLRAFMRTKSVVPPVGILDWFSAELTRFSFWPHFCALGSAFLRAKLLVRSAMGL
jgi:hypothetical protein